jgi:deoxyribodipyrimidine photo-lyase
LSQSSSDKYAKSLFIFRRDLRLDYNTGLIAALQASKQVIPCFIFDPKQIEDKQNQYKSNNALQFMIESIIDLEKQILLVAKAMTIIHNVNYICFLKSRRKLLEI